MAIIRTLKPMQLEKESPHSEVECTDCIVTDKAGRSLQIDTYGSTSRKIPGKKSQSLRFSPEALDQLKKILSENHL